MKKIKLFILLALLLCANLSAQNLWTNESNLNFTVQSNTKVSSAVNENGIHIVYSRNGGIKYALVNSQGTVIKYDKVIESEGSGTDFANVMAIGNNVYAVYYKNNNLRVASSTNLGDNWNASFSSRQLENTGCNKIVAYSDGSNIHITWSELRVNSDYLYDAHYVRFVPASSEWNSYRRVSENDYDGGENPDLVFNSEKVEVNYLSFYQPKNRERLSNGNWNNSESFPFVPSQVVGTKPFIIGSTLNAIYKAHWSTISQSGQYIGHSYRDLSGSTWIQNESALETERLNQYELYPHVTNSTSDGKMHIIYWDKSEGVNYWAHRILTGTTFSDVVALIPISTLSNSLISSSNDLYLLYSNNFYTPGSIKFRHYDAVPLIPSNFAGSIHYTQTNSHPKITWSLSNEPDVRNNSSNGYVIYRSTNGGTSYQTLASVSGSTNTYIDYTINYAGTGPNVVKYKILAKDVAGHTSDYTSVVSFNWGDAYKLTSGINEISDYQLDQNYPNPFNPTTTINYQIKDAGLVTLKIYDVLGKEVAELVNQVKESGKYSVNFDASNLPSGVYIYSMRVNDFIQNHKMTLMK